VDTCREEEAYRPPLLAEIEEDAVNLKIFVIAFIFGAYAATAGSASPPVEGSLLVRYKNLLLISQAGGRERVILMPDAVVTRSFRSLQDLEPGDRLKITPLRELSGVTVAEVLELERGIEPFSPAAVIRPFELWEKIARQEQYLLIDVRPEEEFNAGHIPGSRSLPPASGPAGLRELLEREKPGKKVPLIIYAAEAYDRQLNGYGQLAVSLGYSGSRLLTAGMDGWLKDGYFVAVTAGRLKSTMKEGKPLVLVDTRETSAYGSGHLPGAVNIRSSRLHPDLIMPYDAADPLLFYGADASDREPYEAAQKAASWGYFGRSGAPVMVLEGGVAAWTGADMDVTAGAGKNSAAGLPASTRGMIFIDEFKALWKERGRNKEQLFLDVRSRLELVDSEIGNVVRIPVDELPFRLSELQKEKEIIVYCSSGRRARIAYQILARTGFKARYLGRMLSLSGDGEIH
jgi:rhodanese-related sulfurtransferase